MHIFFIQMLILFCSMLSKSWYPNMLPNVLYEDDWIEDGWINMHKKAHAQNVHLPFTC